MKEHLLQRAGDIVGSVSVMPLRQLWPEEGKKLENMLETD